MAKSIPEYLERVEEPFVQGFSALREIVLEFPVEESIKWGAPCYSVDGKLAFGLAVFKSYFGIWFFHGCFLSDPLQVLINAQKDKTTGMRQWRFSGASDMDVPLIRSYLEETVANVREGKVFTPTKNKPIILDPILLDFLKTQAHYQALFEGRNKTQQREFADHISSAKRESTKLARIQVIKAHLDAGTGLHDKYKKKEG